MKLACNFLFRFVQDTRCRWIKLKFRFKSRREQLDWECIRVKNAQCANTTNFTQATATNKLISNHLFIISILHDDNFVLVVNRIIWINYALLTIGPTPYTTHMTSSMTSVTRKTFHSHNEKQIRSAGVIKTAQITWSWCLILYTRHVTDEQLAQIAQKWNVYVIALRAAK